MSAGGLSYSGLVNYGVVTLPSVETWGTNMNILRDPPKSIMTRRIDKVGETSNITELIDESGDRASDAILIYPRGVNPMVSVEYQNRGNNGGQMSCPGTGIGGSAFNTSNQQAKLPYGIIQGGAFRPPIRTQEQLLPLSRQPRIWTSMATLPGFADFSKKMRCPGTVEETIEVKNETLKPLVVPTYRQHKNDTAQEPYNVKFNIQEQMQIAGNSGTRTLDIKDQYNQVPKANMIAEPVHADVKAQPIYPIYYKDDSVFSTEKYIQDPNYNTVNSNVSDVKQINGDQMMNLDLNRYIQNTNVVHATAPLSLPVDGTNYIHNDHQLQYNKNIPAYNANTNRMDTTKYVNNQHSNEIQLDRNIPLSNVEGSLRVQRGEDPNGRNARLAARLPVGGFEGNGVKPTVMRSHDINNLGDSGKYKISKIMQNNMINR